MSIATYHQNGMKKTDQYLVTPNSAEAMTTSSHRVLLFNQNSSKKCNLTIHRRLKRSRNLRAPSGAGRASNSDLCLTVGESHCLWRLPIQTSKGRDWGECLSKNVAGTSPMTDFSRQVIGFDVTSLFSFFWILFYFLVFYWFYSILKRMEKTLLDIKKLLEIKA